MFLKRFFFEVDGRFQQFETSNMAVYIGGASIKYELIKSNDGGMSFE